MFLVTGLYHLHRVVSSGHSKVVLDQFCPRGERKLKKVDQIYWTESYKAASAFHSKQLFWLASPPLWLLGASQRRPRPACCLCRSHQPGRIIRKQAFFCSVCWFSNQIRKQTHFFGFSNQFSNLTSLAARFTLQKKLTRLNSPWEKGTMAWHQDVS